MSSWKTLAFVALFAVACGKKKEPETAAGPAITTSLGAFDLNRRPDPDGRDTRWLNAPVTVQNALAGEITVNKIEWKMTSGPQEIGTGTTEINEKVAAGESKTFTLTAKFNWNDETGFKTDTATVAGTVHFTGPNGNARTEVLNLTGSVKATE